MANVTTIMSMNSPAHDASVVDGALKVWIIMGFGGVLFFGCGCWECRSKEQCWYVPVSTRRRERLWFG